VREKSELKSETPTRAPETHILLLLVDVTDLEPDVDLGKRSRRVLKDVAEALK
jgi:hypothetical protein